MKLSIACFTTILCLTFVTTFAQQSFDQLEGLLNQYEENDDFNGIIVIAQQGKVIYSRSMGYADFSNEIKLDLNTPMHLASNTKAFTNMGIMILTERGLLDYEDKVNKYLESFPYLDITIQHLMTMTSGLKRLYNQDLDNDGYISNNELLDFLATKKPRLSFTPGEQFQSSVAGYCVLAEVIAKITGKDYIEFIEEEIFRPLQMRESFFVHSGNLDRFRAISYNKKNKVEEWYLGSYIGGVSIYSSPKDLLKWEQSWYTAKLVSEETIKMATQMIRLNNGNEINMTLSSWRRWKDQDNLLFKNGDWVANNSILWRDVEKGRTIIILNNRQNRVSKYDLMDVILPTLGYPKNFQ